MTRVKIATLVVVAAIIVLVAAAPTQFHNLLSSTHTDTVSYSPPVAGDMIAGNSSGSWQRVAPNTSTTPMVLSMTGNGTNGTVPVWIPLGPKVVARLAVTNQTGPVNATLFTPAVDGDFILTFYMAVNPPTSCAASGGCVDAIVTYTNELDQSYQGNGGNISIAGTSCTSSFILTCSASNHTNFHAKGGTPIVVSPSQNFVNFSQPYDLFIVLEEL